MSIFINEITASDAGPNIIRSHLFLIYAVMYISTMNENTKGKRCTLMRSYFKYKDCKNYDMAIPIIISILYLA